MDPHPPGHLQRGGLILSLMRTTTCRDCGIELEGPPNTKRCKPCQVKFLSRTRRTKARAYLARKRQNNVFIRNRKRETQ